MASLQENEMAIYQRNGLWHWRKMVDGVTLT